MFKKKKRELKNPNGYGSVVFLGKNRRRPYAIKISAGNNDDGKRIRKYVEYFADETEAKRYLQQMQFTPVAPKQNITLKEIYEEWQKGAYNSLTKSTVGNYIAAWKYIESLGQQQFNQLRTSHFQQIIDENSKAKSRSTLEKVKLLVHLLYKYALENDIVMKNYAEFLNLPKKEKVEKEVFTDLEIKKLTDNVDLPYVDTILILIYSGMRIGELLALTKFSVDLDNKLITGGLKTEAGKNRIIPIHDKIFDFVKSWYEKSKGRLIFKDDNEPILQGYYREHIYYPLLEELGIPKKTPHCTRHTFATLMARAKASTNSIKSIIGHADYSTTANIYTHTDVNELRKEINMI